MTDWKRLAAAQDGPPPEEELTRLLPVLETLENILQTAFAKLPHEAMPWTGPE